MKLMDGYVRLICSFINPEAAKQMFSEAEHVDNDGFMDDVMRIDPNLDMSEYMEILES